MPRYLYKAKNNKSEIVTGTVRADNQMEAEKVLVRNDLVPMEITPERKRSISSLLFNKISVKDKAIFSRQLATMLNAGLPLTKAISLLAKQAKNDHLRQIFVDIYSDLEEGYNFSSALSKHPEAFDKVFVGVVNSGETTGKLDVVLSELAEQMENDSNFIGKVYSALYYPAFIFVALIGAAFVMMVMVVPKLKTMFTENAQELPVITKILLGMSGFMATWWWLILLALVGLVIFIKYWMGTDQGSRALHTFQITAPGLKNIFEGIYMYRFTRTMSMLSASGVPLLDALRTTATVMDNPVYEDAISRISIQVEKGMSLSSQLTKEPFFPPLVGNMVSVGEETGELDKVLIKVAQYYAQATSDLTKAITSLVEPAILLIVAGGVIFLVFAIYMPVIQMSNFGG
jgi:type IV pilus assembly protein PilC